MRDECIQAVAHAVGRSLTQAEVRGIEERIAKNLRDAARNDRQAWAQLPADVRLREAAKLAAAELTHEAQLKRVRVALAIAAHDRIEKYLASHPGGSLDALGRVLAPKLDGRDGFVSADSRATAIKNTALGELSTGIEQLGPKFLGLLRNREGARDIIREIRGQDTGNAEAKAAAKVWAQVTENLRQTFNRAGGNIGRLDDWGHPQNHSQGLVAEAGRDAWIAEVLPKLDRTRYVRETDGALMTDAEVTQFLERAWATIATGGLNKMEPGRPGAGRGMMANRGNESRQIHFKDADSYLEYHEKFGDKDLMGTLIGHIDGISRDIAMVETLGPNPNQTFQLFREKALKQAAEADPLKAGKAAKEAAFLDTLYANVSGNHPPVADAALARRFDALRNWLTATRLGSSIITSFSDEATMHLTAHVNNLPESQLFLNELKLMASAEDRRFLRRAGLGLETLVNSINRAGQEYLTNGFTQRLATFTIRASALNFVTDVRKQAFGATMMDALGHLTRNTEFGKLDKTDARILASKAVTEADYKVWQLAKTEDWNGRGDLLTPQSIARIDPAEIQRRGIVPAGPEGLAAAAKLKRESMIKLLAAVQEETDVAVITPGARERALMHGNEPRGTWKGELTRSFFLFKSFPIAMFTRHYVRALSMETKGGTAAYAAALIAGTTILGALSVQVNEFLNGRDPLNMNPLEGKNGAKFWVQSLLKGGSLGIYGDFLSSQQTQHGNGQIASLMGPVAGLAEEGINLTQGNLVQLAMGQDTRAGAEFVRMLKGMTPGSTMWYAKAAFDHMIFQQMQEYFSPGYLGTMEARARREYGQTYWWQPGGNLSDAREPDLGKAVGN